MGRLAGFKADDVLRKLRRAGFIFDRKRKGSHQIWRNPETDEMPAPTAHLTPAFGHPSPRRGEGRGSARIGSTWVFGRAQAIVIDPATGVMIGGSDARGEGAAVGW